MGRELGKISLFALDRIDRRKERKREREREKERAKAIYLTSPDIFNMMIM